MGYKVCMDVEKASSRLECLGKDVPCPSGPNYHVTIFTNGTNYMIDYDGNCTFQACPGCGPPNGMPFSFLLIDGADGDKSRGVAVYNGTTSMDGVEVDHFVHDRGQVVPGAGVMSWYLKGHDLYRTSYYQPSQQVYGNRDFSQGRVEPAPAESFTVPKGCTPAAGEASTLMGVRALGDSL